MPILPTSEAWRYRIRTGLDQQVLEDILGLGKEATVQGRKVKMLTINKSDAANSMYIRFSSKQIDHSVEMTQDIIVDIAKDKTVVGLDFQYVTELLKEFEEPGLAGSQTAPEEMELSLQLV